MRKTGLTALLAAMAIAATAVASADAAPRKRGYTQRTAASQGTVFVSRDENGRTRTRIIVTRRSYLDGGTEVLPGQRKFTFHDAQPYWSPTDVLGPGRNYDRQPLNPRWDYGWTRGWY
jgi:hypothetical protein